MKIKWNDFSFNVFSKKNVLFPQLLLIVLIRWFYRSQRSGGGDGKLSFIFFSLSFIPTLFISLSKRCFEESFRFHLEINNTVFLLYSKLLLLLRLLVTWKSWNGNFFVCQLRMLLVFFLFHLALARKLFFVLTHNSNSCPLMTVNGYYVVLCVRVLRAFGKMDGSYSSRSAKRSSNWTSGVITCLLSLFTSNSSCLLWNTH